MNDKLKPLVIPENVVALQPMTFQIDTGYVMGEGLPKGKTQAFFDEIERKIYPLMKKEGWEWKYPEFSGSCPELRKGNKKIYLHPMELNFLGTEEEAEKFEKILREKEYDTFSFKGKFDFIHKIYDCSKEEMAEIYRMNKDIIKENIVDIVTQHQVTETTLSLMIHDANNLYSTGENNQFKFNESDDLCSITMNECTKELELAGIVEKDKLDYRLCEKRLEPYITVGTVETERRHNVPLIRLVAKVKTKDCIPVVTLYFYPDGSDMKSLQNYRSSKPVEDEIKFFVQSNKRNIERLAELPRDSVEFERKQKELVRRWKDHYMNNFLSHSHLSDNCR